MPHNFITIEQALKQDPERGRHLSAQTEKRMWARRQKIVESVLVKGLSRRDTAKKYKASYGQVCWLVRDYLQWERTQRRSNRSSGR